MALCVDAVQLEAAGVRHHVVFRRFNLVRTQALAQGFCVKIGTAATDINLRDSVLRRVENCKNSATGARASRVVSARHESIAIRVLPGIMLPTTRLCSTSPKFTDSTPWSPEIAALTFVRISLICRILQSGRSHVVGASFNLGTRLHQGVKRQGIPHHDFIGHHILIVFG